jgi:hypothetical protein
VDFGHDDPAGRRFFVYSSVATKTTTEVVLVPRTSLREVSNRAGWLAICPAGWEAALNPLKTLRETQGLEPMVVSMQQVADEFSAGVIRPEAIQRLLAYAHANWARGPKYLLLGGDGNANPLGHPGSFFTSDPVYIPVPLRTAGRALLRNENPADAWYGRLTGGDSLPEVAVGRVHARSQVELAAVAQKIADYEGAALGAWSQTLVSVADDGEPFFQTNAETALSFSLPGLSVEKLQLTSTSLPGPIRSALQSDLQSGALLMQFVGHGAPQQWTSLDVLPVTTVTALTNAPNLPVVISMTCEDGYFGDVFNSTRCLAEEMVMNPTGGAVAYLASGVRTTSEAKDLYHRAVMEAIFQKDKRRLGDALIEAARVYLANSNDEDNLLDGFNLFGDPATVLRIPNPLTPVTLQVTRLVDGTLHLSWDAVTHPDLSGYQVYRRIGGGDSVLVATVTGTSWDDTSASVVAPLRAAGSATLAATATRYYSVRATTSTGLGSALHAEVAAPGATTPAVSGGGGGGGGCAARGPSDPLAGSLIWLLPLFYGLRRRGELRELED